MNIIDSKLLQEAQAFIVSAIKADKANAPTQAIVEIQSAVARLTSILDRNPL